MIIFDVLERRTFDLAGWKVFRHATFVRIYDKDENVLFTLKKGEVYDNVKGGCFPITRIMNILTREISREGSLDKREVLSDKLSAFEYAEVLTESLD